MRVAVIMGSTSDIPKVEPAIGILKDYGINIIPQTIEMKDSDGKDSREVFTYKLCTDGSLA